MKTIRELDVRDKAVFLRTEFNVALDQDISDDPRLKAALPTIHRLCENQARVVICSHLGRPRGSRDPSKSLQQLLKPLRGLLNKDVAFADDCIGPERLKVQRALRPGEVLLLENVRYHAEENSNDARFSKSLAEEIDIYVNDAFGNCHRSHASMVGVPRQVGVKAAGLLLEKELRVIGSFLDQTEHPAVAIIGGAKVAGKDGKIHVIRNLLRMNDVVCLVGKIAFFFLEAKGVSVGRTIAADTRQIDAPDEDPAAVRNECRAALALAEQLGKKILLPVDCKTADAGGHSAAVSLDDGGLPADAVAFDIGPQSADAIGKYVASAKSVVWNGPAGYVEKEPYREGTISIARAVASSGAQSLIGGGDTIAALTDLGAPPDRVHICTGGGAMLDLLAGRPLPAVQALGD